MSRLRKTGREAILAALFGALAIAGVAFLLFGAGDGSPRDAGPVAPPVVAGELVIRDAVLSSGGYNAFTGAFLMPNGTVATAFVNVTGPAAAPCTRPDVPRGP